MKRQHRYSMNMYNNIRERGRDGWEGEANEDKQAAANTNGSASTAAILKHLSIQA